MRNNLIQWSSRKQKTMAHSNTESKYKFLTQASIEIIWLQQLFQELGIELTRHSVLWCDNVSVGSLASNLVFHARIRRKNMDVHFIREKILNKELDVRYIPTEQQVANTLTKALCTNPFENLRSKLNVISSPLSLSEDVKDFHL